MSGVRLAPGVRRFPAAAALALLVACGGNGQPSPELDTYDLGTDFTLTSHRGLPVTLADQRGWVCLLFFGFTSCRDVCPVTLSRLGAAQSLLEDAADRTRILFVSVDPRRDTPERLAAYLGAYGGRAVGLTGDAEQIRAVTRAFAAAYERVDGPDQNYDVDHTSRVYLIDQRGQVRYLFSQDDSPEFIAAAVRQLL